MTALPDHRLSILFVTRGYYPSSRGGAENQAQLQAEALVRRGLRVTVVCPASAPGEGVASYNGVQVVRLRAPSLPGPLARGAYALRLMGWVARNARHFGLVHIHALRFESNFVIPIAWLMRRPVYLKLTSSGPAGEWANWRKGWRRLLLMARFATRIQVLTGDLADELIVSGVARYRVACIPNGIDLTRFRPADASEKGRARRELGLPADGLIALYAGTFQALKGTPELLSAWQRIAPDAATLLLVGEEADGYELPTIRGVIVRPWQQDVAAYYRAADVFVLPSLAEGMSNAMLEALASELAVVATRVGAAEELIRDGENGVLVAPGDIDGLAVAMRRVLEDEALRARLGSGAPEAVQALGIEAVVGRIEAVYQEMVGR